MKKWVHHILVGTTSKRLRRRVSGIGSMLSNRGKWGCCVLHHRRWTTVLPHAIAIPLLCGRAKERLSCPENLTIVLTHNYQQEPILEKSLRYVGINNYVVLSPEDGRWPSNTQKWILLKHYIDRGNCPTDYILYIDSDDAVLVGDPSKAVEYLHEEKCDLLFSSSHGTLHFQYLPETKRWAEQLARDNGRKGLYLNTGVFVGKTEFIQEILKEVTEYVTEHDLSTKAREELHRKSILAETLPEFPKGGGSDQMILRYLHPQYHPRIKVDFQRRLALR